MNVRNFYNKLAIESSFHGVKFIFGRNQSKATRIFWVISFIFSLIAFSYYLYKGYVRWLINPDISTNINRKFSTEIPFPAITVCTPLFAKGNFANRTMLFDELLEKGISKMNNLAIVQQNYMAASIQACVPTEMFFISNKLKEADDKHIVKLLNDTFLTVDETITFCDIKNVYDCEKLFNRVLTDRGFCYSFNMQGFHTIFKSDTINSDFGSYKRKKILKSLTGNETLDDDANEENENEIWSMDRGYSHSHSLYSIPIAADNVLILEFSIKLTEPDVFNLCEEYRQNFSFYFHLPNEILTPSHKMHSLKFKTSRKIWVTAKVSRASEELRMISPKVRSCYFENEKKLAFFKTYTKALCSYECLSNYTANKCGCVKFSMPRNATARVCETLKEIYCYDTIVNRWPIYDKNDTELNEPCGCLRTCNEIIYGVNSDDDHATVDNSVIMKFQFSEQIVEVYDYFLTYKLQNFVADTGGLLGLFLGCSVLSIIEVIYFSVLFVVKKFIKPPQIDEEAFQGYENTQISYKQLMREFFLIHNRQNHQQKLIMNLQIQMSKNNEKSINCQEISAEKHFDNPERSLSAILNNIDEGLKRNGI